MSRLKDETLSIRTSAEIKQLLRLAAERERRSVASMIEILVLEYARAHDLHADGLAKTPVRSTPSKCRNGTIDIYEYLSKKNVAVLRH